MLSCLYRCLVVLTLLLTFVGCGDNNNDENPSPPDRIVEFIPIEIVNADFDLCDTSSFFSVSAEVEDFEGGDLLDNVTIFISLVDNPTADDGDVKYTDEKQFAVKFSDEFTIGPNGRPLSTFSMTLQEVSSTITNASFHSEDEFRIRFEINLTDGRKYSSNNYPFVFYAALVIPLIDEPDFFSGQYLMEQLSGSDPFFNSETFGDSQIVDIIADDYSRSFDFLYFPGMYDAVYNFTMNLECGTIQVIGNINEGSLGCGSNIGFSTGDPVSSYDQTYTDDDVITVNVSDFKPDGSCNSGDYPVVLRFTKQ